MRIEYDRKADAIYISLAEGDAAETREVTDTVIIDFDREGKPLGIELLFVSSVLSPDDLARVTVENLLAEPAPA